MEWIERGRTPEGAAGETKDTSSVDGNVSLAASVDFDWRMLSTRSREGGEGRVALVRGAARKAKAMLGGGRSNIWTSQPNKNMHPGCGGALLQRSRPGGERRRCGL